MKIIQTIGFSPNVQRKKPGAPVEVAQTKYTPFMAFMAEHDLGMSIYVAANEWLTFARSIGKADVIVHEVPDDTDFTEFVLDQTVKGVPERSERDKHYDTLRFWGRAYLHTVSPKGIIQTTQPVPDELTLDDLKNALADIASDQHYQGQRINLFMRDGTHVMLHQGKVEVKK